MNDTGNIPQFMIEAAARALWKVKAPRGRPFDELGAVGRCSMRDQATAILAAAFAECEVTEEFGHSKKVAGAQWHSHQCPTSDLRRLVVVTPAQEETANG